MRRYKFRVCIPYVRRALVCLCVSACMSIRVRVCVACVVFTFYYMYIVCTTRRWHDYLDWKKVAARSRGAGDPIAIVCLLEEGFTLSRSPFLRFCFSSAVRRFDRAILVQDGPLPFGRPSPELSQARNSRTLAYLVRTLCVSLRQFFFFFFWL